MAVFASNHPVDDILINEMEINDVIRVISATLLLMKWWRPASC
jgi:hypothetical protein